jgi:hypothetical protein
MSSILYYSNFCEHSKKLLQTISKANITNDLHFICIDKRVRDNNGKMFIVLENGQQIIMPENVNRVPALLLLSHGFQVLYGESILQHLRPKQEAAVRVATHNNLEPMSYSFGNGGFGDIVSDNYSFLDQDPDSLMAKGNGGARQMHNYVDLNYSDTINTPTDEHDYKGANKLSKDLTIEQLQQQREADFKQIAGSRQQNGPF